MASPERCRGAKGRRGAACLKSSESCLCRMLFALFAIILLSHVGPTSAQGTLGGPTGPNDELLLWYKLDESFGTTTAADSSGNGFTGALYTTDGYFNTLSGVPNFDAEDDSGSTGIQLPTSFVTAFLRANNYTIMLHFNGQATEDKYFYLAYGTSYITFDAQAASTTDRPFFRVQSTGTISDLVQSGTAVPSTTSPNAGTWYHIAVTYQKNTAYKMYVNGQVVGTLTSVKDALRTFPKATSPIAANLGCQSEHSNNLDGLFRDFRVYNRTLTQDEVIACAYSSPTRRPTAAPTPPPTRLPTVVPTPAPTRLPTRAPTPRPTTLPSGRPSTQPSNRPSNTPTRIPSAAPTPSPTRTPTLAPTPLPTKLPSRMPTNAPTPAPTRLPTQTPSKLPSTTPTLLPTTGPTVAITGVPSPKPTSRPSQLPSTTPTRAPSTDPTVSPTRLPSARPTPVPTLLPTLSPSRVPTEYFTYPPTNLPSPGPSKGPTRAPTGLPTSMPTLQPTAPTVEPTLAPTQAPTKSRFDSLMVAGRKVRKSCAYQSGPALGPMGLTLGLIFLSASIAACYGVRTKSRDKGTEAYIIHQPNYTAEAIALRKVNLAMRRKVFWGGQVDIHSPVVLVPNPLKLENCKVWDQDLSYHVCNHAWLPSMCFSDPLDAFGGPWGHRASFLLLGMLLFAVAAAIALYEDNKGKALPVGQVLLILLLSTGLASWQVHWWCRGLYLGFGTVDVTANDSGRQAMVNSTLISLALIMWAVVYTLVYTRAQCGSTRLVRRLWALWLVLLVLALMLDLPPLLARYMPRRRSLRVRVLGFTVLRLNDWKKQLLIHTFHHQTRLKRGALMDNIRAWREEHRANPALTDECGNFEMAIAHVRFTLLCFITVVEYDVPKELRPDFQEAPELLGSDSTKSSVMEPSFASTQRVAQMVLLQEQEEIEMIRKATDINTPVLGAKRQIRRIDFDPDDEDSLPAEHLGIHRNVRVGRFADGSSPASASARIPRGSPSSARVAPSLTSDRQEDDEEEKRELRMLSFAPASVTPKVSPAPELLDFTRQPSPSLATEGRRRRGRVENDEGPDIPPMIASPRASDGARLAKRASRQLPSPSKANGAGARRRRSSVEDRTMQPHRRRSSEGGPSVTPRQPRTMDVVPMALSPRGQRGSSRGQRGWDRDEEEDGRADAAVVRRRASSRNTPSLQVVPVGGGRRARGRRDEYEVEDIEDVDEDEARDRYRSPY